MKNIYKLFISLIIAAFGIFVFQSSANALYIAPEYQSVIASGYYVPNMDSSTQYNYNGKILPYCVLGYPGNETFCVYYGVAMWTNQLYNVTYRIELEGKDAKVYKGNTNQLIRTTTNDANAMLLAQLTMEDTGSLQGSYYSQKQYSIWAQFPSFNRVNQLGIVTSGMPGAGDGGSVARGQNYLKELAQGHDCSVTNNTNSQNVNIETYVNDGISYIKSGPYNFTFNGSLDKLIINNQDDKEIDYLIGYYEGTQFITTKDQNVIKSGKDFYVVVNGNGQNSQVKVSLKCKLNYTDKKATIWCISKDNGRANQNLITITYENSQKEDEDTSDVTTTDLLTDLHIKKVNTDNHDYVLPNVHFKIKNDATGKYVGLINAPDNLSTNKVGDTLYKIDYVDENNAYEFKTDENGQIDIYDIIIGEYKFIELLNENYGYEENPEFSPITLTSNLDAQYLLENKQILVKLSGYVWEDIPYGKDSSRNDLYNDNDYDEDILLNDIPVRLIDKTTQTTVQETLTGPDEFADGSYLFEDVLIEKLKDYIIEFEYDGLVYTNVVAHIDLDNGSKAAENPNQRVEFNERFGEVKHKDEEDIYANKGYTIGIDGQEGIEQLNYTWGTGDDEHTSRLLMEDNYFPITATTDEAGYIIWNHFTYGMEEIKYINLGVYKRAQPDLALMKDVVSAKLTINDYENLYIYANKSQNVDAQANAINVGVKFQNRYTNTYTQPIYHADAVRQIEDTGKELHAYVTYSITVFNQSIELTNKVQEIVDYFDTRYNFNPIVCGREYNEQTGEILDLVDFELMDYDDSYRKLIIYSDLEVDSASSKTVYITLSIDRQGIYDICNLNTNPNTKELLDNIAEINSYSTYLDGQIYAGIDIDSAPGNAIPGDLATYEDDTDIAPGYELEFRDIYGGRNLAGKVFEDYATDQNDGGPGKMLLGNGIWDNDEPGIANIKVELQKLNETTNEYETAILNEQIQDNLDNEVPAITYTDENGNFEFIRFVPDEYRVVYIWGDQEYVGNLIDQNGDKLYKKYTPYYFKSTITPMWQEFENNYRYNWYKEQVETRYNDAQDLAQYIENLNKQLNTSEFVYGNTIDYKNNIPPFTMHSVTLSFKAGIEMGDDEENKVFITQSDGNKLILEDNYLIENIDFGIIEKGRTVMNIVKKIDSFKLTLSNGTVFAQGTINDDGTISGDATSVTFVPKSEGGDAYGQLTFQIDSELMLGSVLQIKYKFNIVNDSSLVYDTLDYYYYGIPGNREQIIKVSPALLIDYLDKNWTFTPGRFEENAPWQEISKEELINMKLDGKYDYISDEVKDSYQLDDNIILINKEFEDTYLEPGQTCQTVLVTDSKVTNQDGVVYKNSVNIGQINRKTTIQINDQQTTNQTTNNNIADTNTSLNLDDDLVPLDENYVNQNEQVQDTEENIDYSNVSIDTVIPVAPPVDLPGAYIPGSVSNIFGALGYPAEHTVLMPPTGSGSNTMEWVIAAISGLSLLGVGLFVIIKVNKMN